MLKFSRGIVIAAAAIALAGPAHAQSKAYNPADAAVVANAMRAVQSGNPSGALAMRTQVQDEAAKKLIAWYVYSRYDGRGDFAEVTSFIKANPLWPAPELLARAADRSITPSTRADLLLTWFTDRLPETGHGLLNAVEALRAQGKAVEAQDLLRRAWRRIRLTDAEQAEIVKRYGGELRPEDHVERIAYIAANKQKRAAPKLFTYLADKEQRAAAEMRLKLRDEALRKRPQLVDAALADTPATAKEQEGFLYDLMRWNRRVNRSADALAVATKLPATLSDPVRWWKELDIVIRDAIATRQYDVAYQLARNHRQIAGSETYADAEFLAGFIALRLLNQPEDADKHFAALAKEKLTGWDAARLNYWMARSAEARGDKAAAQTYLRAAALHASTFYGQLAASRLGQKELALDPARVTPEDRFWGDEVVRAAHLLRAAGEAIGARLFAVRAGWNGGWSSAQHAYLAKFALDLTAPDYRVQTEVRMAKIAARDGIAVTSYGFPAVDLPEASSIEPALVYAVIRQESEFLAHVKSHAGAQGLMQLMPATARNEAKDIHMPYALHRLTSDAGYNLRLGTQHLARLRDYYQGSYPLMVAAYNAGVGRVDRWLAAHGDPRTGKVEWADWIELIPFEETRLYTKYVLENHAIYRVTLGDTLEVPQLARYWQAPPSDPVYCNSEWAKLYTEVPDVIPVSAPPPAAPNGKRAKGEKARETKRIQTEIPLVRKEKPDNRAGIPSC